MYAVKSSKYWCNIDAFVDSDDIEATTSNKPNSDSFHLLKRVFNIRNPSHVDLQNPLVLQHHPITTIVAFPHAHLWVSLISIPLSATQCRIRCSVFSDGLVELTFAQIQPLKLFVESHIQMLEARYNEIKTHRPPESSMTSDLKAHLRLERLTGMEIHPARADTGGSESFCKAEKSKYQARD